MISTKMIMTGMTLRTSSEPNGFVSFARVLKDFFSSRPENGESKKGQIVRQCPYLDTINRHVLDFDFEKVFLI